MDHFKSVSKSCQNRQETCKQKLQILDDFKREINKLNLVFDRKHRSLTGQIQKLTTITDELESMHKNATVGSLTGAVMGAAGGITSIVGLALAPVTLGVSLALTAVGGVVGAAGGATGTICSNVNNAQQKRLRETIEKITTDFQNTINAMLEILKKISNSTEDIQWLVQQDSNVYIPARMMQGGVDKVRGVSATLEPPKAEMVQSEAAKLFDEAFFWSKEAKTAFQLCSGAVKKINTSSETTRNIYLTSKVARTMRLSSENIKIVKSSAQTPKALRSAAAVSGVISALCVVADVYGIVQNSVNIYEMNQSADKRNAKDIKSKDLKFIHRMRETAAHFQKIRDEMKGARDTAIKEFNRELQNGTSFLVRQTHRGYIALIILSIVMISIVLVFLIL